MRLSSHDASFLYTETASGPMHSVGFTILDGPATFAEILDYYAARIHLIPRLRQKLVFVPYNLAHPKWVDDPDFDLSNHFVSHHLPPDSTVEDAINTALELGEILLDRSKPLWLAHVLENAGGKTIVAQLSHHAFVDGATAIAMSTIMTDVEPLAPAPAAPVEPWHPPRLPSQNELLREAIQEQAEAQVKTVFSPRPMMTGELMQQSAALLARLNRPVMQAPWNASLVGPKRKFGTLNYTIADFKIIRKTLGGTLNDVAVSIVSEGAARYMKSLGELTDNRHIRLMCPVNVRTGEVDMENLDGNRVSAMFPILPAQPMAMTERLAITREEIEGMKKRREAETLDLMQESQLPVPPAAMMSTLGVGTPYDPTALLAQNPAPVMPSAGFRPVQSGFNFTVTNVPGPTWTQYLAGYRVEAIYGTLMLSGNLGLGASVGSFDGKLVLGFTADPRLADVEKFKGYVSEAFDEMMDLATAE